MNNNLISEYIDYRNKTKKEITYEEFLEMLVGKYSDNRRCPNCNSDDVLVYEYRCGNCDNYFE